MASLSYEYIGAVRVGSRKPQTYKTSCKKQFTRADATTERLASYIPYWPEVIEYSDLAKLTGLTKSSIEIRVSSCHARYMIFTDRGRLSRLKNDLSNCI